MLHVGYDDANEWKVIVSDSPGACCRKWPLDSVVRVCSQSEVAPGSVKGFAVGDKTLAVHNIDGAFYATDDECTHAAASLADGMIEGDVIECCMHLVPYPDRQGDPGF